MRVNKTGIISVACGVAGLALCWNKICVPFILLAFVFGIISLTDYLGYKIPAICGMAFAVLATAIVFVKYITPFIQISNLTKEVVKTETTTPQIEYVPAPTPFIETPNVQEVEEIREADPNVWETDEWRLTIEGVREELPHPQYDEDAEIVYIIRYKVENKSYSSPYWNGLYLSPDYLIDSQGQMGWDSIADLEYYNSEVPIGAYVIAEHAYCVKHKGNFTLGFIKYDSREVNQTKTFNIIVD